MRVAGVAAFAERFSDLVNSVDELGDDLLETEEDEAVRVQRMRAERKRHDSGGRSIAGGSIAKHSPQQQCLLRTGAGGGGGLRLKEPEGAHRHAKLQVLCRVNWKDATATAPVTVEVDYKTRHGSAWPDDHYMTEKGSLRFVVTPPKPGLAAYDGSTVTEQITVPLVYNRAALEEGGDTAAADPLHFQVILSDARIVSGAADSPQPQPEASGESLVALLSDTAAVSVGNAATTVYLTTPTARAPQPQEQQEQQEQQQEQGLAGTSHALERWSPSHGSVPFCRTCGRVGRHGDGDSTDVIWAECLLEHGLPQRLAKRPRLCPAPPYYHLQK